MGEGKKEYSIREIQLEDCAYLASLHMKYFGPSIIAVFGERFLRAAYQGMIGARYGKTIIYQIHDETIGFATIMFDGGRFFREILKKKGIAMGVEVVRAIIRNPFLFRNVTRALFYPGSFSTETRAELLTLITREDARGRGVGSRLMDEVKKILREEGVTKYKVSVKKDWTRAVDFYRKIGFTFVGEIDDGKAGLVFLTCDISRPE